MTRYPAGSRLLGKCKGSILNAFPQEEVQDKHSCVSLFRNIAG